MSEKGSVLEALNRRKRAAFRAANSAKALVHAALLEAPSSERSNEVAVRLDSWNICLGEISDVIASILDNTDLKGKSADQLEVIEGKMYEQWQQSKEEYDLAKSKLNTMNDFLNPKGSNRRSLDSSLVTDTAPANPLVKLPDLPVPKFSGKTKDFTEWYSLFQAMIHSNDNIKPIQKLYFLKQAMVGAAENILKDYTLQEGLYEEAWNAVKSRYYNRRAIIADHFQELMALPPISQTTLRESLDQVNAIIRGLMVCELNTEAMSPLFTYIIVGKLPEKLRMDWENSVVDNSTYPSFAPLSTFLQNRCFAYESVHAQQSLRPTVSRAEAPEARMNRKFVAATAYNSGAKSVAPRCVLCDKGHYLSQCPQFITKNIADRWRFVKDKRLCINCLRQFHFASDCNSSKCRRCNKTHHTMLHQESSHSVPDDRSEQSSSTTRTALACTSHESSVVLLPSAAVYVLVGSKAVKARALLDPCSQVNLVAESFVKKNRIASRAARAAIACVSPEEAQVSASVSLDLRSRYSSYQLDLQADVVGRIPYEVSPALIRRVKDVSGKLDLADCLLPTATVDILIGGNHANKILLGRKLFVGELCFEETLFGWVAEGPLSKFPSADQRCCHLSSCVAQQQNSQLNSSLVYKSSMNIASETYSSSLIQQPLLVLSQSSSVPNVVLPQPSRTFSPSPNSALQSLPSISGAPNSFNGRIVEVIPNNFNDIAMNYSNVHELLNDSNISPHVKSQRSQSFAASKVSSGQANDQSSQPEISINATTKVLVAQFTGSEFASSGNYDSSSNESDGSGISSSSNKYPVSNIEGSSLVNSNSNHLELSVKSLRSSSVQRKLVNHQPPGCISNVLVPNKQQQQQLNSNELILPTDYSPQPISNASTRSELKSNSEIISTLAPYGAPSAGTSSFQNSSQQQQPPAFLKSVPSSCHAAPSAAATSYSTSFSHGSTCQEAQVLPFQQSIQLNIQMTAAVT